MHQQNVLALAASLADLRLTIAQIRLGRAIDDLARKYRPDQPRAPKGTPEGGQWIDDPANPRAAPARGTDDRQNLAWMPTGFTKHGINQAINRGVSAGAIYDALNNPLRIVPGSSSNSWKYIGSDAVVVLNPFGTIVTVWPQ